MQKQHGKPLETMDVVAFVSMTLFVLAIFFPFYNAVLTSLMSAKEYTQHPVTLFPREIVLDSYRFLLGKDLVGKAYLSSIFITVSGSAFGLTVSVLMAYGFSRARFPGKKFLFRLILFTMFFDGGLIPTYILLKNLKLIDNRLAIILLCGVSTFNIILLKSSFEQTPAALEEAAKIDGANDIRVFWSILLPLQMPILATITLFLAVGYWNEWFWSMLVLNSRHKQTLQLLLRSLITEASAETEMMSAAVSDNVFSQGVKMAAVIVTMLPIMLVYPFVQKYFVKGLLVGAIKM